MAECQYSPDSGRNSHPSASMTCVNIPVQERAWSVAGLASRDAMLPAGQTIAVATKAASSTNVNPNN